VTALIVAVRSASSWAGVRILAHPDSGLVLGIRQYPGREEGAFDEYRTGLDHFAFGVSFPGATGSLRAEIARGQYPVRADS
jgi:hypothetical protein